MQKLNDFAIETHISLFHGIFVSLYLCLPLSILIPIVGLIGYGAHFISF